MYIYLLYIHTRIPITTSSNDALDGIYLYTCTYNMYKQPTHCNSDNSGALCRVRVAARRTNSRHYCIIHSPKYLYIVHA